MVTWGGSAWHCEVEKTTAKPGEDPYAAATGDENHLNAMFAGPDANTLFVAAEAGAIRVSDSRRTAAMVQQSVMSSWFGNRLVNSKQRITAEETWQFCLRGLGA